MNSISSIKKQFQKKLINIFPISEILSIWRIWVVKEILDKSFLNSVLYENDIVSKIESEKINLLIKHLLSNQPVQYFFGYSYLKNLKLNIDDSVLIPRPETEELVDLVIKSSTNKLPNCIIDIGTGSGCIAIALKKKLKSKMIAVDISESALSQAKKNAHSHDVDIEFNKIDILNLDDHQLLPKIDYIVSNPPYVTRSEISKNSIIYAEPQHAIFVPDKNPLIFYESILKLANSNLNVGGKIFFEINPKFVSELVNMIKNYRLLNIEIHKDFFEKKRFIIVSS